MLRELLSRILRTFRRRRLNKEFDDEIRGHLEMLEQRFVDQGMADRFHDVEHRQVGRE